MPHRPTWLRPLAVVLALLASPCALIAQSESVPAVVWRAATQQSEDFTISRDTSVRHGGRASVKIDAEEDPGGIGNVLTTLSAAPYRGRRLKVSAFLRSANLTGDGVVWVRADDSTSRSVAFVNTQSHPVRGNTAWMQVTATLDIPASAARIFVGVFSSGKGTLWADDVRVEADGASAPLEFGFERPADLVAPPARMLARSPREAPRALSDRGLANLTAFTRALGYVRFFHPSAEAVRVNWDDFAVRGARAVERAPTPDSLASTLRALFVPVAPTVTFWRTGAPVPAAVASPAGATHVVYWQHSGIGSPSGGQARNPQNAYQSVRVILPASAIGTPVPVLDGRPLVPGAPVPRVPDPAQPLMEQLAGGVTIRMPVALFTDETSVPDSMRSSRPLPAGERFSPSDRATRIADVALAWSLFQHFYPYFDVVHVDWSGALAPALRAAATDSGAADFQATLQRLVAALHDGHGNVIHAMRGVGRPDVELGWAEAHIVITAAGDSGAARGIHTGDVLVTIDGRPADAVLADSSALVSGATPQWIRYRTLAGLLLGPIGSSVTLGIRDASGAAHDVRLARTIPRQSEQKQVDKIAELAPGVMYVDLGRITDADFAAVLPRLQAATGIVFDMRGYPSQVNTAAILAHLADSTIHSAHFEIPVLTMPDRREVGYTDGAWTLIPVAPRLHARIAFLGGGGSISYAESTLGVVEAYHLADIVGQPSAGTNGNVNPFVLPGGYTVVWTGMRVVKRDGSPHHGVGVIPTVAVSPTIAGIRAGRDEVLERAVELVRHR